MDFVDFYAEFNQGFLRNNLNNELVLGVLFAMTVMSAGTIVRWQRQYYEKKAKSWLPRYGQDKQYSLLNRIIKRLLNK